MRKALLPAAAALLLAASPAHAQSAPEIDEWCPSLMRCCVEGEADCTHPGAARGLLLGSSTAAAFTGVGVYLGAGDSLNSGDPFSQMVGVGAIGMVGAGLGALAGMLSPRGETSVPDHPGRPTLRLSLSPGSSSVLDESSPFGIGGAFDPHIHLGDSLSLRPNVSMSIDLGASQDVDPRPQHTELIDDQKTTFPVALRSWRLKASVGTELTLRLPYPVVAKKPLYTGRVELRFRQLWEVRRRVLHPGDPDKQVVEHHALYPTLFGLRWHVSPRQRFTFYFGPRFDWLGWSDPGSEELHRGGGNVGSFYSEVWWQLDIPFTPEGQRATSVTGRFNLGYTHSNLDNKGLDIGAVIGFFGPVEVSFDLRLRKLGSPVAVQLTGGWLVGVGGGPFVEVGLVTPSIGKGGDS